MIARTSRPHGRWRETRREALDDAVAAGMAWPDEHEPGRVLLGPLAFIQSRED